MKRNILRACPIIIIVTIVLFFEIKGKIERRNFLHTELNNKIIKIKENWSGGCSYDYVTENGIIITLLNSDTLKISDSISKETNTGLFDVYRKEHGIFKFNKRYDYFKDE